MKQALTYSLKVWLTTISVAAIIEFGIELSIYKDEEIVLWLMLALVMGVIIAAFLSLGFSSVILLLQKLHVGWLIQKVSLSILGSLLLVITFIFIYGFPSDCDYQIRMWIVYSAVLTCCVWLYKI